MGWASSVDLGVTNPPLPPKLKREKYANTLLTEKLEKCFCLSFFLRSLVLKS